jgi:hypothetical protein
MNKRDSGTKEVPLCEDCGEEFSRLECTDGWHQDGFCDRCRKFTRLCKGFWGPSSMRGYQCIRRDKHEGKHLNERGEEWETVSK